MSYFRPKPGDVFEFKHDNKFCYFQYLHKSLYEVPLIRYYRPGFSERPDLDKLLATKESGMALCGFVTKKFADEIKFCGNYPVPSYLKDGPEYFLYSTICNFDIENYPPYWSLYPREYSNYEDMIHLGYYLPEKYRECPDTSILSFLGLQDLYDYGTNYEIYLNRWPEERVHEWEKEQERKKNVPPKLNATKTKIEAPAPIPELKVKKSVTIKMLRQRLGQLLRDVRRYVADATLKNTSKADVETMKKILEDYLASIFGNKKKLKILRAATKEAVKKLNKLDERTDHELIETDEREALYQFFSDAASYIGYNLDEEIDNWREW